MIDALYEQLIKATIQQNRKLEEQLMMKLENYDKLYRKTEIPFDDRLLTIRWIKLPTFLRENKPTYYAVFLVDISFWRKGELKTIYQQIIESIDSHDVDNYTIFLVGKLHGFFDKMDNRPRYYHIFRINTDEFTIRERKWVVDCICNFLENRIQKMTMKGKIHPVADQDITRIRYFIDTFRTIPVITYARARHVSKTSLSTNEVLANTTSMTSHSHITREGME